MPSRRPHTKSRHGCLQCKASHIKCDQGRPSCGSCRRKEKNCIYQVREKGVCQSSAPFEPSHRFTPKSTISEQEKCSSPASTAYGEACERSSSYPHQHPPHLSGAEDGYLVLWEDLELMRHFVTETYLTFSNVPVIRDLWRTTVPKMASDHPLLMHTLLSVSAHHLAFLNPAKRGLYLAAAVRHHELSLPVYRSQLHNITPENCSAMFICSSLIPVCTLAFPMCSNNPSTTSSGHFYHRQLDQLESPIQLVSGIFSLLQGASQVIKDSWQWLGDGPICALFVDRFPSMELESNSENRVQSYDSAFQFLIGRINSLSSRSNTPSLPSPTQPLSSRQHTSALTSNPPIPATPPSRPPRLIPTLPI
ncbi:hypothetical protein DL98DRAFT_472643 [Cadophora sp. DSE1049]|nr:hypothetical protein DL98DRAFT_472643 [Cadophora sp. DSE1049]